MKRRALPLVLLAGVGLARAPTPAFAQVPPPPRPPPRLTRDEIRECLLREDALRERHRAMEQATIEHRATGRWLDDEAQALDAMLKTLARSDAAAVNAYNARNDARNAAVQKFNARASELDASGEQLRRDHSRYVRGCISRPSSQAERDAVRSELGWSAERGGRRAASAPEGTMRLR
jgi:hypothetical protein